MTASQLKEILKSNILTMAVPEVTQPNTWEDHILSGAHILLAPACLHMNQDEADILEGLLEMAADKAFVAGQISAPDESCENFDYEDFYQQCLNRAGWLYDCGASLLVLTGFKDIIAAKCALYAIFEAVPDMPVCMGIGTDGGEDAVKRALSMLIALQPLNICAFGCTNMDIEDALELLSELQAFTTVPLFALPDKGTFLEPEMYSDYVNSFVNHKCALVGLANSSATYTAASVKECWQLAPLRPDFPVVNAVCSQTETLFLDFNGKMVSHNKQLLEIKTEKEEEVEQALSLFNKPGTAPVCFNIKDIDVLEYAISHYAGRPAVRSDEYGKITAKEFGAFVISDKKEEEK